MFSNKAEPTGRRRPRQWRGNMLLVVLSLSLLALAMEFIVFRFIFPRNRYSCKRLGEWTHQVRA